MNGAEAESPKTRMRRREKGRISAKQNKIYGLGTPKLRHYELIERASLYWINAICKSKASFTQT